MFWFCPAFRKDSAWSLAQALACGCPVIASKSSGAPDLFEHGREGTSIAGADAEPLPAICSKCSPTSPRCVRP